MVFVQKLKESDAEVNWQLIVILKEYLAQKNELAKNILAV